MIKLIEIMNFVLASIEIPTFKKKIKQRQYYEIMIEISRK